MKQQIQIGVMGSMADVKLSKAVKVAAKELGEEIAKSGATLLFGFEGDFDSLSAIAARSAQKNGGLTVAFVWGDNRTETKDLDSIRIATGQLRGGGREFPLVLSCNVIITIGGGSGTLMEMTMAYQAGIPLVALKSTGGWSGKLAGKFIDDRKRQKVFAAKDAKEAVRLALKLATAPR